LIITTFVLRTKVITIVEG